MADEALTAEEESLLGTLLDEDGGSENKGDQENSNSDDRLSELQRQLDLERQRNASLQGRVESQIRPLSDEVRSLKDQLKDGTKAKDLEIPNAVSVQDLLNDLSTEDREAIGEKQLSLLAKMVEKPMQSALERLKAETKRAQDESKKVYDARLAQLESQIAGQTGNQFWDRADEVSPGIKAANNSGDPRWLAFLDGYDSASGRSRRDLGNSAVQVGDVVRVAALHNEFLESIGAVSRDADTVNEGRTRPDGTKAEGGVGGDGKPTVKQADVEKFFSDLSRGKYEGREKIAEKMETAIMQAIQEGRVV